VPVRTILSSSVMETLVAVKVAVHLESHSWPIEIRGPALRLGTMWALRASSGTRAGTSRSASWVDCMELPAGSSTVMLGFAGHLLMKGASEVRKWPVLPVSAIKTRAVGSAERSAGERWQT
jgi:hypothetical protein